MGLGVGSSLLFGLIGAWLKNWAAELSIKYDLERLTSKIQDELPRHRGKIASIQSRGKQAYANVTIAIVQGSTVPVGNSVSGDHAPVAELELVEISEDNLDLRNRKVQYTNQIVSQDVTHRFTSSFPISVSDGEVALFRSLMNEMERWESSTDPNINKLDPAMRMQMPQIFRRMLIANFGPLVEFEVLNAKMWPNWKKR